MSDFLSERNIFGSNILHLVSRGNAIIAEILRLKDFIPPCFRLSTKEDQLKFGDILLDFTYFKQIDEFEKKVESSKVLKEKDEEIKDHHLKIIKRFYLVFESIYNYVIDLNTLISELEEGSYIQQNFESVFNTDEGKQLMCEALHLYGVMLLLVDSQIDGFVRERLLVSYYRYSVDRKTSDSNVDDICKLLRSTAVGKTATLAKKPVTYPEDFFKRIVLNPLYVNMVIGRLRSDDIYHQLKVFPLPDDRSTGLASQASMLVVCLFFQPTILHSQTSIMREIVDKYFPDNWIVNLYMGEILNLITAWEPFKAARLALSNTLESSNITDYASRISKTFQKTLPMISQLNSDILSEDQVLQSSQKLSQLVREGNVALRWTMLHTIPIVTEANKKCRQISALVSSGLKFSQESLFKYLLSIAELELHLKETLKKLLSEKEQKWMKSKNDAVERIFELTDAFSGDKPLIRLQKNEKLYSWFKDIAEQIKSLDQQDIDLSSKKLIQLIQALEKVQEFHGLSGHGQVTQILSETRTILHSMLRTVVLNEDISIQLQVITDMSYAWLIMDTYTELMQKGIKQNPALLVQLRATFLKMASALEVPLLRITLAKSPDLVSVSQYYSTELVNFVRKVLHIIPETMFQIMANIATIQTFHIKELPTRLDKEELRDFAQLDQRFEVAKLTHDVSVLTEGITMMKTTLVGVIRIDPIQLLEDGIRKELVKHIATALHQGISFHVKQKTDLIEQLDKLGDVMDGHKRSFEYIQDYVHIYGLKIWQEELSRIIWYSVEQEANQFTKHKVADWQSEFQSEAIPIPNFPSKDAQSVNFMGRLFREILRVTDPKSTIYLEQSLTWYDGKTRDEILDLHFWKKITRCLNIPGVAGLDKLLCHQIASHITDLIKLLQTLSQDKEWMGVVADLNKIIATGELIRTPGKTIGNHVTKVNKVCSTLLLDYLLKIGQIQIIRKHLSYELSTMCQFEAPHLYSSLVAFNEAVLSEIHKPGTEVSDDLLAELSAQLDHVGLFNPDEKIYTASRSVRHIAMSFFIFTYSHLGKLAFSTKLGELLSKKQETIDASPLIRGIYTVFHQFHEDHLHQYLHYLGLFVKSCVVDSASRSKADASEDVITTVQFMEALNRLGKNPRSDVSDYIPPILMDLYCTNK